MKKCFVLIALTGLAAGFAPAQYSPEIGVELGYQSVDVTGNENVYRSQENLEDGLLIGFFRYNLVDSGDKYRWFDRFRIDATGFGGSPQGRLDIRMGNADRYDLTLSYARMEHFNALPGFANPFLNAGITPGQHTLDRTREILDFELTFLPNNRISPFLGFSRIDYSGPGLSTYHVGLDEFAIESTRDETEDEIRVGLDLDFGRFQARLMQGWRQFEGREDVRLLAGAEAGNNLRAVLGEDIYLNQLEGRTESEADTPVTSLSLRAQAHDRIMLSGSFIMAELESDVLEDEMLMGNLASFQISRFYSGRNETIASNTKNEQWVGKFNADIQLPGHFKWRLSYAARNRELDGQALISTLYLDAVTFGSDNPLDFMTQLEARTYMEKDDTEVGTSIYSPNMRGFRIWADVSLLNQETEIDPDLAQIVAPSGQGGDFEREINAYALGLSYRVKATDFRAEWQSRDADDLIIRTDYQNWSRIKARIRSKISQWFLINAKYQVIDQDNDAPSVGYQVDQTQYGIDLNFMAEKHFTARLSYGVFDLESETLVTRPQDFAVERSDHREDGEEIEAEVQWKTDRFEVSCDYARYETEGVLPFDLERMGLRAGFMFAGEFGVFAEYRTQEYTESLVALSAYDVDTAIILFRWSK